MLGEQEEKKILTLSDIARELGVNKATVSKAISGKGSLSAETRARILDYIDKCGYRPNAVAQSLALNRTYNIGLMVPGDAGIFDMAFFRDCLHGICMAASASEYDVLITMDSERPVEQIARLIDHRKIDGVIAMRSLVNFPVVGFLKEKQVPFVLIGDTSDPEVLSVDNDNRSACRDLTSLLISRGIRKMCLLGGNENYSVTHSRLQGFRDACEQCGLSVKNQRICLNVRQDNRLSETMNTAVAENTECIVCMDDYICALALSWLRDAGLRIPTDIKIVSFYDSVLLEGNKPPITSLRFNTAELGRIACKRLIHVLDGCAGETDVTPGYQMMIRDSI